MSDLDVMMSRAEAHFGDGARAGQPLLFTSQSLGGTVNGISWGATLYSIPNLRVTPPGIEQYQPIIMPKKDGRIMLELWNHQNVAFYVEVSATNSNAAMKLRWDSMMEPTGPSNGIAAQDLASGRWFFGTPYGGSLQPGIVTIDGQVTGAGGDADTWSIYEVYLVPVQRS